VSHRIEELRRKWLKCRILIELEGSDEPAWTYLEYQHAHILDTMRSMHSKSLEKVKRESLLSPYLMTLRTVATRICAEQPSSSNSHIESLKKQLATSQYHLHPTNRKPPSSPSGIPNEQRLRSR
jgi:exocyst complex component 2